MGQDHSKYLASLNDGERVELERRLWDRQSGACFICPDAIDLVLHKGQLEIDHIEPLAEGGADADNNFAIVHAQCNRQKGAADLRVARRMAEFDHLQLQAQKEGGRGANLGHVLHKYGGAKYPLRLKTTDDSVSFSLSDMSILAVRNAELYKDQLSGMRFFFSVLPVE